MPEIQMPKLSDTMTEGTLIAWKKKKGDQVSAGEVLAEIETDKATMEWESPEDGTLTEIYIQEGGKVNVGERIAFIGGEGEEAQKEEQKEEKEEKKEEKPKAKEEKQAAPSKAQKKTEAVLAGVSAAQPTRLPPQREERRGKASPGARRNAAPRGAELSSATGARPQGR